jgi:GH24 family phage-related lysozyme (muramidase)
MNARINLPSKPSMPGKLMRRGVVPAFLVAALSSPLAYNSLSQLEGNILHVYKDKLANDIPTYCAGRTDWKAPIGAKLTSDQCTEVNKTTLLEYGYEVLACTEWKYLTPSRVVALTLFAINIGKGAACGSGAVREINRGNIMQGCSLIAYKPNGSPNWSYADGVYVPGLWKRRKVEATLCTKDVV